MAMAAKTNPAIIAASTPLFAEPGGGSGRETDCLFGETLQIHGRWEGGSGTWHEITLDTDGYRGWLHHSAVGELPAPSHRVIAPRALLTEGADIKTPAPGTPSWLPMGALVKAAAADDPSTMLVMGDKEPLGHVPSGLLLPVGESVADWVAVAESLIGTPYRWGGRDSVGIDCSALVQLALAAAGRPVPRNSGDQERAVGEDVDAGALRRGDLVFWKGHVGVMADARTLLHANMHHAMSATEPLAEAVERFEGKGLAVTRYARP